MTDAQGYAATLTVTDWSAAVPSPSGPVATCSREGASMPDGYRDLPGFAWRVVTITGNLRFPTVNGYTKSTWADEAGVEWVNPGGPGSTSAFFVCGLGTSFSALSPWTTYPLHWSSLPSQPSFAVHLFFGSQDTPNQPGGDFSWIGQTALLIGDTLAVPCASLSSSVLTAATVAGGRCQVVHNP